MKSLRHSSENLTAHVFVDATSDLTKNAGLMAVTDFSGQGTVGLIYRPIAL
jgi:hypothetical protein